MWYPEVHFKIFIVAICLLNKNVKICKLQNKVLQVDRFANESENSVVKERQITWFFIYRL